MKKMIALAATVLSVSAAWAQTLNVTVGNVTYAFPAAQAGNMVYSNGTTLTILNKAFTLSEITSMTVDNSTVTDNSVTVTYSGTSANVTVAGNVAQYLTVSTSGADVSVTQSSTLTDQVAYTLSGTSTDGSFLLGGSTDATVVLNGLSLTNTDGYAVYLNNSATNYVQLAAGTTNSLVDGASGSQKGCLMVTGATEFSGTGSLSLTGNYKHAMWTKKYVTMGESMGAITVNSAVGDGFNLTQYFQQKGGTLTMSGLGDDGIAVSASSDTSLSNNGEVILAGGTTKLNITGTASKGIKADANMTVSGGTYTITTSGDGTYDEDDADTKASSCLSSDANIVISGGTLNLTSTGSGGKGINCDGTLDISDGTITVKTTGAAYTYGSLDSNAKAIKADGNLTITGGTIDVTTTGGEGSEGIESKAVLTISGGTITANTYDDAINSSSHMYIKGGQIYVNASNNDGLDANGNLYIQGGTLVVYGATAPECGIDANEEDGYSVYITGGTLVAVGGNTSYPVSTTGSQPAIIYTGSVSKGTTLALNDSSGKNILAFTMGKTYSSLSSRAPGAGGPGGPGGGGNNRGSLTFVITSPNLTTGSKYTLYSGATVSGTSWNGLYTNATVSSTGTTLGTVSSLATPYSKVGN